MANELAKFQRAQQAFAEHIKSPQEHLRPDDVDERAMSVYRDLFFKNIMSFLTGGFPVLAEIIGEQRWQEIGRGFFTQHHNKSPYFLDITQEFLFYLKHEYPPASEDPPYMYELAHYEWLELYVDVKPEVTGISFNKEGDILCEEPLLSPAIEGCVYQYPVHQISAENPNPGLSQSALIVFRKSNDTVGFVETNAFTLELLSLLKEGGRAGREALSELLLQNNLQGQKDAYKGGIETLKQWHKLGIIWGTVAD